MDTDELVQLMRRQIREEGDTQKGFAEMLRIHPTAVSKLLAGKRRLRANEADILRRFFGLKDEARKETQRLLPIVGLVAAGAWREGFENIMGHMPSPDRSLSPDAFVVQIEGDSMDKLAQHGEQVIVDPRDLDLVAGKAYVVRNASGETTFKLYCENPPRLEPCSNNPEHKTILIGAEAFTTVGRVRKRVSDL